MPGRRNLLFFVSTLFKRAKRLRRKNDVGTFKDGTRRFIAEQLNAHLYARFTPARQAVEIAPKCAKIGNGARLTTDRRAVTNMGIGQNNGAAKMALPANRV